MDEELWYALIRALVRILSLVVIGCVGLFILVLVTEALLPRVAHAATVFIASPGGLAFIVLACLWLRRRRK